MIDKRGGYRNDIQVLRGISILSVLIYHSIGSKTSGYLGVDIFFVISGFVITPMLREIFDKPMIRKGIKNFWRRRFFRLAPALSIAIIFSAVLIFLFFGSAWHGIFAKQGIAQFLLLGNFSAFWLEPDYFNAVGNPLIHTWSLSVEEQIYILIPLIIYAFIKNKKDKKRSFIIFFIVSTFVSLFLWLVIIDFPQMLTFIGINKGLEFAFYSPIHRLWQFTLGGLVSIIGSDQVKLGSKKNQFTQIILVLTLFFVILGGTQKYNSYYNSFAVSLIACLIIKQKSLTFIPIYLSKVLKYFGDRSYSIYLYHLPILYVAKNSPIFYFKSNYSGWIVTLLSILLTLILGSISFREVENRFKIYHIPKKVSFNAIITFWLIPLMLVIFMLIGSKYNYWQVFKQNYSKPPYAQDVLSGCIAEQYLGKVCRFPNGSKLRENYSKKIVLVGDSHAGHLSLAIREIATRKNWQFIYLPNSNLGNSLMSNAVGFRNDSKVKIYDLDYKLNKLNLKNSDLIIISQFITRESNLDLIKLELELISRIGANLLLIENTPVWPDKVWFNFNSPIIKKYDPPKWYPESAMDQTNHVASKKLANWFQNLGHSTLNLNEVYCQRGICSRFSQGKWLFFDNNHLSIFGASLSIPTIESELSKY